MLIGNHPRNLVRILPRDKNSSQLNDFGRKLTLGQSLQGKIVDILSAGKVVADFQGQTVTLQTAGGLVKGQSISVKVEQLLPSINLKIINPPTGENVRPPTATPDATVQLSQAKREVLQKLAADLSQFDLKPGQVITGKVSRILDQQTLQIEFQGKQLSAQITGSLFRPGQPIIATVRQGSGGLTLVAQNPNLGSLRVDASRIKPYLVARQDLGQMTANLKKMLLNNPLLKDLKIDPGLLERLRDTIQVLLPKEGKPLDNSGLKEQVDRSGINYEAKVKKAFTEKLTPEIRAALTRDLKGQLLELQDKLEKQALQEGRQASAAGQGKSVQELVRHIKLASDNIEFQQLSNQLAKQESNPILLQIPDPFSPETKTAKLYIRNNGERERKKQEKRTDYNLVFLLNLTALGNLRVDAKMRENDVTANIKVEEKPVADFIAAQAPQLESRLKALGFSAVITSSVQETVEMEVDEPLSRMLIDEPSRLVDIKT